LVAGVRISKPLEWLSGCHDLWSQWRLVSADFVVFQYYCDGIITAHGAHQKKQDGTIELDAIQL